MVVGFFDGVEKVQLVVGGGLLVEVFGIVVCCSVVDVGGE